MTSNVGADTIKRGPNLGFAFQRDETVEQKAQYADMRKTLMDELKRQFRPEFINRVDSIIVFRQLSQPDIRKIVDFILIEVNDRLVDHELTIEATEDARNWLGHHGYDPDFGARPLRRLIQTKVEDKLSDAVLSGQFNPGDIVIVDVDGEDKDAEIVLRNKEESPEAIEEALPAG